MKAEKRHIEEAALNAWPALQTYLYDGWIVRFANGYTKRANSVTPLGHGTRSLLDKINYCETLYARQEQPTIFRFPSFVEEVNELDGILEQRGYERIDETVVQVKSLEEPLFFQSDRSTDLHDSSQWLPLYHRMDKKRTDSQTHEKILNSIVSPTCYLLLTEGQPVACGLGVCEDGYLGLFDIVTDPAQRRQGYGEEVMTSLIAWGQGEHNARQAYLQVVADNGPALNLYAKLGFTELYRYWYRIQR